MTEPDTSVGRVALFCAGYLAILVLASALKGLVPAEWGQLVWALASSVAIVALTLVVLRREGRTLADVSLSLAGASTLRFIGGISLGLVIYAANIVLVSALAGSIHFTPSAVPAPAVILLTVSTYLALSLMEELGFRGYPLRTLVPTLGFWRAQLVVAAAFALSHIAFGWPWQTVLLGVFPNGLLFGAAALASRGLALPIGLHAALNIASWAAGEKDAPGVWTLAVAEPARDRVAMLAPVIGIAITTTVTITFWIWTLRRGRAAQTPLLDESERPPE